MASSETWLITLSNQQPNLAKFLAPVRGRRCSRGLPGANAYLALTCWPDRRNRLSEKAAQETERRFGPADHRKMGGHLRESRGRSEQGTAGAGQWWQSDGSWRAQQVQCLSPASDSSQNCPRGLSQNVPDLISRSGTHPAGVLIV